ncbi:MAG TPA: hypothetical protein VI356_05550 [Myxococcales bacterium]
MVKTDPVTSPWGEIRKRLETYGSHAASRKSTRAEHLFRVMLELVEAIENSPRARVLHAWMTHFDLCIVRAPAGSPAGGRIQISPLREPKFIFEYKPDPMGDPFAWNSKPRTLLPIEDARRMTIARYGQGDRWFEEADYADGLAKLDEVLDRLGWFSRAAVS